MELGRIYSTEQVNLIWRINFITNKKPEAALYVKD